MELPQPYLLFLGDVTEPTYAKTAFGLRDWARDRCIGESWLPHLLDALAAGLDLISGMHARLADAPALKAAAQRHRRRLIDIRTPPPNIPIATGRKRTGKRTENESRHPVRRSELQFVAARGERGAAVDGERGSAARVAGGGSSARRRRVRTVAR